MVRRVPARLGAPAPELDDRTQEIIGGSFDTGMDPAVGFLISRERYRIF